MAYSIVLSNPSHNTDITPKSLSADDNENIKLDRVIYQYLGSLIKNKNLMNLYDANKIPLEYRKFLDEMNDLFMAKEYSEFGYDINDVKKEIIMLDQWLGALGQTEEYSYSKDWINVKDWIDSSFENEPIRVLVDMSDNTYLTDSAGTKVLVRIL